MENDVIEQADISILDAETRDILERLSRDPFLDPSMPPEQMRAAFDSFYSNNPVPAGPISCVRDVAIDGPGGAIALRIYTPLLAEARAPIILFYHGGGMVMGSIAAYDGVCRRLAQKSGAILVSASYRLAPEHKFPAAPDDAWAALQWVSEQAVSLGGDPDKLVVAGESGGGNLATGCALRARDEGGPAIAYQVLINPAVGTLGNSTSMQRYARGFFFEPEALDWIYSVYLEHPDDAADVRVSPILSSRFDGLPPAFIVVAGCDILRDDIERYAELLKQSGVAVEQSCYETTIHGFTVMAGSVSVGLSALDECASRIRAHFEL